MSNLVLALDPGRTTGFALARIAGPTVEIGYSERKLDHSHFWNFLVDYAPEHVVCESFEYRRQDNVDLYPCELIGVLNFWDQYNDRVKYQKPKQAVGKNAAYNDAVLKRMGLHFATPHHGRDACRHLLVWLIHGPGYKYIVNLGKYKFQLVDVGYLMAK